MNPTPPVSLHIPRAHPSWGLILQSGVVIACTVGIPLAVLLREGLGLRGEQLRPIDSLLLDGMPVDEPERAIVPDGSRVALAAGLPGIAGLAMKSGSAVKALRSGITHAGHAQPEPRPGTIVLCLYSLALSSLAGHFLQRGVVAEAAQILRYARFAPADACLLGGKPLRADELSGAFAHTLPNAPVLLTAQICPPA